MNIIFAFIYVLELILRLLALGFNAFFRGTKYNHFDVFITIASIIDVICSIILVWPSDMELINGPISSAIVCFRLLRVVKLARY